MPKPLVVNKHGKRIDPDTVYKTTIKGVLNINKGSALVEENFQTSFKYNQRALKDSNPLALFKVWVKTHGPHKWPGFSNIIEAHIVKTESDNPEAVAAQPFLLNRSGLLEYIDEHELPIDPMLWPDAGALRSAIFDCERDEEQFVKNQEHLRKLRAKRLEKKSILDDLNPVGEYDDEDDELETVGTKKKKPAKKKAVVKEVEDQDDEDELDIDEMEVTDSEDADSDVIDEDDLDDNDEDADITVLSGNESEQDAAINSVEASGKAVNKARSSAKKVAPNVKPTPKKANTAKIKAETKRRKVR